MSPTPNMASGRPSISQVLAIVDFLNENAKACPDVLPEAAKTSALSASRMRRAMLRIWHGLASTTCDPGFIDPQSHLA